MARELHTIKELLYWAYSNHAMMCAAISLGVEAYDRRCFMTREKIYRELMSGEYKVASFYQDEKEKMSQGAACSYCGSTINLSVDHMLPQHFGGMDDAENLVCCCRKCNSSKNDKDMMLWMREQGKYPNLHVWRRYLKLVEQYCKTHNLLECTISEIDDSLFPFKLDGLRIEIPSVSQLKTLV